MCVDVLTEGFEVCFEYLTITRLVECRRGMQHRNHDEAFDGMWHTMHLGNPHIGYPACRCMSPQWNYDSWLDEPDLTPQKGQTGLDFSRQRITIVGRAVLDDIGNKHVGAIESCQYQQTVQDAS